MKTSVAIKYALILWFVVGVHCSLGAGQSGAGVSVDDTALYLNSLLTGPLWVHNDHYLTGYIIVDSRSRKIWYSRILQDEPPPPLWGRTYMRFSGAKAAELDPDGVALGASGISVKCLPYPKPISAKKSCFEDWSKQLTTSDSSEYVDLANLEKRYRDQISSLRNITRFEPQNSFQELSLVVGIDEDAKERFIRAFRHLIFAVRSIPSTSDPNDPFAR